MKLHKAVKKLKNGERIYRDDWRLQYEYLEYHYSDRRIWFYGKSSTLISYAFEIEDFDHDWEVVE